MYIKSKSERIAAVYKTMLLAIHPNFETRIPIKAVAKVSQKIY